MFLMQCSSVNQAPDTLNLYLKEVFLNPNKLLDIKKNFPEYTVDSLLDSQMRERMYINGVISFIASEILQIRIPIQDEEVSNQSNFLGFYVASNAPPNYILNSQLTFYEG